MEDSKALPILEEIIMTKKLFSYKEPESLRIAAIAALVYFPDAQATELLKKLSKNKIPAIRSTAQYALKQREKF